MRKSVEIVGLGMLAILCWITWAAISGPNPVPVRIPTHFDLSGTPNGWGSPKMLFLLPVVASCVYLLISVLASMPAAFRYSIRVNPENLPGLQDKTRMMISWIKLEMTCLFTYVQWSIIQAARDSHWHMSPLMVPIFLVVVFGTIGWHLAIILSAAKSGANSSELH
jgi:uncharacterized membrane protein